MSDELEMRAAWRMRILEAVIRRQFDDETLCDMLTAGFHQAHEEGLRDAADIAKSIAKADITSRGKAVAEVIYRALNRLIRANNQTENTEQKSDAAQCC